ncbi:hypothetical protein [Planobispora longispora]|uniref:hypothetical protein n=1 Tax=Planobispora longispora TaxID=28887 RepID=UPI001942F4CA|nr:hypothetical protein [Planobispora longispora]
MDIKQLLFGESTFGGGSFALRAAVYLPQLVSPVTIALLVGAVLLAGNVGPAIARLKIMVYVAVGTLALAVLFGTIGLLGGLFGGATDFLEKVEFLLRSLPLLGLGALALLYLLPKAIPARAGTGGVPFTAAPAGFRPDGGLGGLGGHPQEYQQPYAPNAGGPVPGQPQQAPFHGQPQQAPFPGPQAAPAFPQEPAAGGFPQEPATTAFRQQEPAAPAPAQPYSPPALPPAPAHSTPESYGAQHSGYGQAPAEPAEQQPYTPSPYVAADVQPPAPVKPYEPPAGVYGAPIEQAQPVQHGYAEPQQAYSSQAEQAYAPQADPQISPYQPSSTEPQLSGYASPSDSSFSAPYTPSPTDPRASQQLPSYGSQEAYGSQEQYGSQESYGSSHEQQAPYYPAQPEAAPAQPYTPADSQPRLPFDSQASFPQPPDNYGQPLTGYSGAEFARQAAEAAPQYPDAAPQYPDAAPHYSVPDPMDARSQQIAHAYQQAESYQQQAYGAAEPSYGAEPQYGGTEPQLRLPEYTASQPGTGYDQQSSGYDQQAPAYDQQAPAYDQQSSGYDSSFGQAQPPQTAPQWETPPADATLRFDPGAYRADPLGGPAPAAHSAPAASSWESPQPIDPTAIYTPERSGQAMGEETGDRERVGPGQEQSTSWYGSDRREH